MQMQPQPQHKTNYIKIGVIAIVVILIFLGLTYLNTNTTTQVTQPTNPEVYITQYVFNFNCSNCASQVSSYTVPAGLYLAVDSTLTEREPFGPYPACYYISNVYSATPDFTVIFHPLPLYIPAGQSPTVSLTVLTPSHSYYGQLVINVTQSLC